LNINTFEFMNTKSTLLVIMMLTSFGLFSQTTLRQPDYNLNNIKTTNALQINPINNLSIIANYLSGPGVIISNVKFNGSDTTIGNMIGYFELSSPNTSFGIDTGIIIANGGVTGAIGPNNSNSLWTPTGCISIGDPQLSSLVPGSPLYDEFDFIPLTDTVIACKFVFGSEEYPEFVNSVFNDVFGFFITGANPLGGMFVNKNLALIPGDTLPILINTVNPTMNSQYYINNTGGQTLQYDGYTTPIMLQQVVIPGQQYHFKVGVADAMDQVYDSGVFMKIKSFYGYASMPVANFSFSVNGNMVTFDNTTNWAKYFVWDFGDGTTDTIYANNTSITHVYSVDGTYDVSIEAHNYYQVNKITKTVQIGNLQGVGENKGNTFELIPSGTENTYQLNISLNQSQDVSIYIVDISGKPVRTIIINGQKEINQIIDISNFSKGVYILKINSKETSFCKKLINK